MLENPDSRAHRFADPAGIDDFLLFRMSKVVALGGGVVTRICEGGFGITRREWTVMATVARHERIAWADVAERCEIDGARLSRAVTALVAKGLLARKQLPSRQIELALTDSGRELYGEVLPLVSEVNAQVARALDAQELATLERMLAALHERGEAVARDTPVPKADRLRKKPR